MKNYLYFHDRFGPYEEHVHALEKVLYEERTPYQLIQLVESPVFGKMLIIDGDVQSSVRDEYIYHESLVHPAMLLNGEPKTVIILGGGEGATAREVLKHKSVVKVIMIDIDREAISLSKQHLKEWHQGAFEDKRLVVINSDARSFIESEVSQASVDVVISDLTEPFEGGPSFRLFSKEFYKTVFSKLKDDGLLAIQSSMLRVTDFRTHSLIRNTVKSVFPFVSSYSTYVPSFDTTWSFILASKKNVTESFSPTAIDAKISEKVKGVLRFYSGTSHAAMFSLSKDIEELISSVGGIIADNEPLSISSK
ncbi:MAG: methyltransferase domain-containing protein [Caldisericaceae bacterium]